MSEYLSDEEQVARLKGVIKNYGSSVLTGGLLALAAYFGWNYWQNHQALDAAKASQDFQQLSQNSAMVTDKASQSKFISEAQKLAKDYPDSASAMMALWLQAKVTGAQGEWASAEKALTQATEMKAPDEGLSAITWLRLAQVQVQENKLDAALTSLDHVKADAFAASRDELKGDIFVQKKDINGAKQAYESAWAALTKRQTPRDPLKVKMTALGLNPAEIKPLSPVKEVAPVTPDNAPAAPASQPQSGAASS